MRFFHHPDHIIYLEDLQLHLDFFLTLEPSYSLPKNAISQEYKQGKYHRIFDSGNQWGSEEKWEEGDRYLGKIQIYKQAWEDYRQTLLPPTPELPPQPNWSNFRSSILSNTDYQNISNTTLDQRSVTRLESAATVKSDDWGAISKFWNSIIQYAIDSPNKSAIATWNEIAIANNMPFSFDNNGLLIAPVPPVNIPIPPPPPLSILPIQIPYATTNLQATLDQLVNKIAQQQAQITLLTPSLKPPLVEDNFTSLIDTPIDARLPETNQGSKWVKKAGNWILSGGSAKSDGTAGSLAWIECGKSDRIIIESDVFLADSNVPQGIVFRLNSISFQHWRAVYTKTKFEIVEVTNSSVSRVNFPEAIAFNQTYRFKVLLDGANINFLVNGISKCSWISTNNLPETKVGMYSSTSLATKFESFKVNPI